MENRKNIIITGITGQDGIFLTENLIRNNPDGIIYGFTRNHKNNTISHPHGVRQLIDIGKYRSI